MIIYCVCSLQTYKTYYTAGSGRYWGKYLKISYVDNYDVIIIIYCFFRRSDTNIFWVTIWGSRTKSTRTE